MKTGNKFHTRFEKATPKTKEEIKASCEKIKSDKEEFDIRSNGNHIWVELGREETTILLTDVAFETD